MFNQKMLSIFLHDEYEILTAVNETVGIQLAKLHGPSLILLDAEFSDVNCFNLLETLKNSHAIRSIPVIIMTGADQINIEEEAFFYGAADFIRKPLRKKVVLARVRAHINMWANRRMIEENLFIDMTTGVHNRQCADLVLLAKWNDAQHYRFPFSIGMMDIDFFKEINRMHGFEQAERVLKQVAVSARKVTEAHDGFFARYQGDKFILVFLNADATAAQGYFEEIRLAVLEQAASGLTSPDGDVITVSIGGDTVCPDSTKGLGDSIATAEKMLRNAKNGGRNCIRHNMP